MGFGPDCRWQPLRQCALMLVLLLTAGQLNAQVTPPAAIRATQVDAYRVDVDESGNGRANRAVIEQQLAALGYSPVWEKVVDEGEKGTWSYLLVGKHENLPDTTLTKIALRNDGFSDAYERAFPNTEGEEFETTVTRNRERRLVGRGLSFAAMREDLTQEESEVIAGLEKGDLERVDLARAKSHLARRPDRDAVGSRIARLANQADIAMLSRDGVRFPITRASHPDVYAGIEETQIRELTRISMGAVPATKRDRIEAAFSVAQLYQEYLKNSLRAYDFYNEILDEYRDDEAVQVRASVLKAAVLLELARSDAAYFNEVKRACEKVLHRFPDEYVNAKAVADLMRSEAHFFDGDFEKAENLLGTFRERYPDSPREIITANYFAAYAAVGLKKKEAAVDYLARNLSVEVPADEAMRWVGVPVDMQSHSILRMSQYMTELGIDRQEADALQELMWKKEFEVEHFDTGRFEEVRYEGN
jgi:hypothetical protein